MDNLQARAKAFLDVADKAMPAPWKMEEKGADEFWFGSGYLAITPPSHPVKDWIEWPLGREHNAEAAFIVAARNDAPALVRDLLAEVERMSNLLAAVERMCDILSEADHA